MTDVLRLAVAQPRHQDRDARALDQAAGLARRAVADGARLVLFPEAYPGPSRATERFDGAVARMAEVAVETGLWIAWGSLEAGERGWEVVHHVHRPDGTQALRYARAHPATGDVHPILNGTGVAPGEHLATFDLDGVTVGLLVCSELWLPEVARIHALRGAEVILAPAGGGFSGVARNWEVIARARAIENQCHVCLTVSRFGTEAGSALIAGPEDVLARAPRKPLIVADADLARARWLGGRDDSMEEPKPFASLPGLLRARRPELYGELAGPRPEDAYDYRGAARAREAQPSEGADAEVPA